MAYSKHVTISHSKGTVEMSLWLIFTQTGNVRMTRDKPKLAASERAMQLTLDVPKSIFTTPQLKGKITLSEPAQGSVLEIAHNATEALKGIGVDLNLSVVTK